MAKAYSLSQILLPKAGALPHTVGSPTRQTFVARSPDHDWKHDSFAPIRPSEHDSPDAINGTVQRRRDSATATSVKTSPRTSLARPQPLTTAVVTSPPRLAEELAEARSSPQSSPRPQSAEVKSPPMGWGPPQSVAAAEVLKSPPVDWGCPTTLSWCARKSLPSSNAIVTARGARGGPYGAPAVIDRRSPSPDGHQISRCTPRPSRIAFPSPAPLKCSGLFAAPSNLDESIQGLSRQLQTSIDKQFDIISTELHQKFEKMQATSMQFQDRLDLETLRRDITEDVLQACVHSTCQRLFADAEPGNSEAQRAKFRQDIDEKLDAMRRVFETHVDSCGARIGRLEAAVSVLDRETQRADDRCADRMGQLEAALNKLVGEKQLQADNRCADRMMGRPVAMVKRPDGEMLATLCRLIDELRDYTAQAQVSQKSAMCQGGAELSEDSQKKSKVEHLWQDNVSMPKADARILEESGKAGEQAVYVQRLQHIEGLMVNIARHLDSFEGSVADPVAKSPQLLQHGSEGPVDATMHYTSKIPAQESPECLHRRGASKKVNVVRFVDTQPQ